MFHRNWSVSAVLESATWSSSSVFSSFYLHDLQHDTMVSCLWVRLWLQARGSGSPHLFLTCSGVGGGPTPSLSLLLLGSFTCFGAGCGACPTCANLVLGILPVLYVFYLRSFLLIFSLFVYFNYVYYVSLPNVFPVGLCILDT